MRPSTYLYLYYDRLVPLMAAGMEARSAELAHRRALREERQREAARHRLAEKEREEAEQKRAELEAREARRAQLRVERRLAKQVGCLAGYATVMVPELSTQDIGLL